MIHVDVKKLGRIPAGGGWRLHGRDTPVSSRTGTRRQRSATTSSTPHRRPHPLAYSEIHPDERDATCAGFLHRALAWFAAHHITLERVLTDNAMVYRHGSDWGWVCSAWQLKRRFTQGHVPRRGV